MNHVELTIADLRAARNRADMLIAGLLEFQAGCDGTTSAPTALATVAPPEPNGAVKIIVPQRTVKVTKRPTPPAAAKERKVSAARAVADKLFVAVAGLAEPFTPDDLVRVTKDNRKRCENFMVQRVVKKEFVRVARGQYARGPKFPAQATSPRPSPPAERETKPQAVRVRKLGERPGLVPMARGDARPTKPAPAATITAMLDKPESLGQAMKLAVRPLTKFNGEKLRDAMLQDARTQKLFEAASPGLFQTNLTYWTKQGYLTMVGETPLYADFTVTAVGKEWFAK